MNEHPRVWVAVCPVATPLAGCLDNVTELLQATGEARVTAASGFWPGRTCPREQSEDWGEGMASLARQFRAIVRRGRSSVTDAPRRPPRPSPMVPPLSRPAPSVVPGGDTCPPTRCDARP